MISHSNRMPFFFLLSLWFQSNIDLVLCAGFRNNCTLNDSDDVLLLRATNGKVYTSAYFDEAYEDVDELNVIDTTFAHSCSCSKNYYCLDKHNRCQHRYLPEDGEYVKVICFYDEPPSTVFNATAFPIVMIFYGVLLTVLILTDVGRDVREHFKYKLIYPMVVKFLSNVSDDSWSHRTINYMTINTRMENAITEQLSFSRESRQSLYRIVRDEILQGGLRGATFETDVLTLSGIARGAIQVKLMLKKKLYLGDTKATCSICLDDIQQDDIIGDIYCRHLFHLECLKYWMTRKNSCPLCQLCKIGRSKIDKKKQNPSVEDSNV